MLSCVHVLIKRNIRHFHVVSRATTAKKVTKYRDARAKLLFCQSRPIATSFPGFCQREPGNEVQPIAFFFFFFFAVLVAVAVLVAYAPYSIM